MASEHPYEWKRTARGMALLVAIYLVIVYVIPRPESIKPEGWRLTGIFIATVAGLIAQPLPGGAIVLLGVTMSALIGGLTIEQALAGYADKSPWLVMAAIFISRALVNTGLGRRIALFFVRLFGKTSLGVTYALSMSDMVLAGMIPSNSARSGGIILPIARSISELYGSKPGATAGVLGCFMMTAVYQSICVTAAMFYTGQASNPLAAKMAASFGYTVTWASWLEATIVPGLVSLLAIPLVVMWLNRPEIIRTPEASAFAARELHAMGPLKHGEKILTVVFVGVCGLWATSSWNKIDITLTALMGAMVLIVTGVLDWEDVKSERAGWDIFIWYGGLIRLSEALNGYGVTKAFAEGVGRMLSGFGWVGLFLIALVIYFYAHYLFASITAHLLSMFPPFLAVLLAKGAPIGMMVFAFACFANFSAGLTNYGTTPTPLFFAQGYVSLKKWWTIGFVISVVNIVIWMTVGFSWWKLIHIW
ncbi:MAG TPA: DASS family sodium-coupled anion symporter [Bryobacteraceae bacterium]|nr:DASS family sodium-coupled anion symporter [Bryobacteraceae bacterium]